MPAAGAKFSGFKQLPASNRLGIYYKGTLVAQVNATDFGMVGTAATTTLASTTTITAGTGVSVTTGNATNTAGDSLITAGNLRLGAVSAFATTEPTSAVVMKVGTNPVGAITTSGGIFVTTGGATISKIIAAGTVSQIEA